MYSWSLFFSAFTPTEGDLHYGRVYRVQGYQDSTSTFISIQIRKRLVEGSMHCSFVS